MVYIKRNENEYKVIGSECELKIHSNTHGDMIFIIDSDDVEKCKCHHWCIHKHQDPHEVYYYAISTTPTGSKLLHRLLTNAQKGDIVDHINRITFDNRKENLRICNMIINARNKKKHVNNTSGYTGVIWSDKIPTPKWQAYIMLNYKHKSLGYFDNIDDAIKCRKEAELKYFGEYKDE